MHNSRPVRLPAFGCASDLVVRLRGFGSLRRELVDLSFYFWMLETAIRHLLIARVSSGDKLPSRNLCWGNAGLRIRCSLESSSTTTLRSYIVKRSQRNPLHPAALASGLSFQHRTIPWPYEPITTTALSPAILTPVHHTRAHNTLQFPRFHAPPTTRSG